MKLFCSLHPMCLFVFVRMQLKKSISVQLNNIFRVLPIAVNMSGLRHII